MSSALRPLSAICRRHHHGAVGALLRRPHAGGLRTPPTSGSNRSRARSSREVCTCAQPLLGRTVAHRLRAHTLSTQGERRCSEQPQRRRRFSHRPPVRRRTRRGLCRAKSQQRKSGSNCPRRSNKFCNERWSASAAVSYQFKMTCA